MNLFNLLSESIFIISNRVGVNLDPHNLNGFQRFVPRIGRNFFHQVECAEPADHFAKDRSRVVEMCSCSV